MTIIFYISAAVAVVATIMVVTRVNAVHALLYLIVSLLAVAVIFFLLGAPFVAALEVIIYAGAIMVLFIFVIMMFNLGPLSVREEQQLVMAEGWIGPSILCVVLLLEVIYTIVNGGTQSIGTNEVSPKQVGIALFGPYLIGVELASLLLLSGLVGAYHLGRREKE